MTGLKQPIVYCTYDPYNPYDAKLLSEVAGDNVGKIFITNIGHFHAAGKLLEQVGSVNSRF